MPLAGCYRHLQGLNHRDNQRTIGHRNLKASFYGVVWFQRLVVPRIVSLFLRLRARRLAVSRRTPRARRTLSEPLEITGDAVYTLPRSCFNCRLSRLVSCFFKEQPCPLESFLCDATLLVCVVLSSPARVRHSFLLPEP